VQSGAEKMMSYLAGFASGLNLSVAAGGIHTASVVSYEQLVIDSEILQIADRYIRGISVDRETLALEAIEAVGPGGNFLVEDHTLHWLRKGEHHYPLLFNRTSGKEGTATRSVLTAARERAAQILAEHQPMVPADVAERVKGYVRDKTRELRRT
jgi:trimethylamine--corrinoid protein Co-methyltransferase